SPKRGGNWICVHLEFIADC
ncbi:hypothetical protein VCHC62B1_0691B, partial [Vibrio cholerae HC-62B1]